MRRQDQGIRGARLKTVPPPPPIANELLFSLSRETYSRLAPHLELVCLEQGETMYDIAGPVACVHFPVTALISAFVDMPNGASAEVALVGKDGAVGIMALMCGARLPFRTLIDTGGYAYRARHGVLHRELAHGGSLQRVVMRYLLGRTIQVAGNVVCNSHHSVEQRLCRALLMRLDRVGDRPLFVTQEMLADILAVRRPGVTAAAANLRRAGAIDYHRGRLTVVDRKLLHDCACECYDAINKQIGQICEA